MAGWRYFGQRITKDGFGPLSELSAPLQGVSRTQRLSTANTASGLFTVRPQSMVDGDGNPLFKRWSTAIYAEYEDEIRDGWLVKDMRSDTDGWKLDLIGFAGYLIGLPYDGSTYFIEEDPLNIFRHIWTHAQEKPAGNLDMGVDTLTSPVRVGTQLENVEFVTGEGEQVAFEAGPKKLNYWQTHDLGKEIDDYAQETPFDWTEEHSWAGIYADEVKHRIRLGYPRIGMRRADVTGLVYGQNVMTRPPAATGEYANECIVLGAGEGRDQIRGYAGRDDDSLRRVKVVEDKTLRSKLAADNRAVIELAKTRGEFTVETIRIRQHDNLDLWGIQLGDELPYYAETDEALFDFHVRVIGKTTSPDDEDTAELTVIRADTEVL